LASITCAPITRTIRTEVGPEQPDRDDLVRLAFGELRRAAATQPTVCIYLLEALHLLREGLDARGLSSRTEVLVEQARLVVTGCEQANMLPADLDDVGRAYDRRFGSAAAIGLAVPF